MGDPLAQAAGYSARFSVIIPTLQRAPQLMQVIAICEHHPLVEEVLIINNSDSPLPFSGGKLRVLEPSQNIYVNPAWNWGAREARGAFLAFANDDIIFAPSLVDAVHARLSKGAVGIIGPGTSAFTGERRTKTFRPVYHRTVGMGTLLFMRRESFVPIPESLLIWCGDDWLFRHQRERNYTFHGWHVRTPMSVTSGAPEFSLMLQNDRELFEREYARLDDPYLVRFRWERALGRLLGSVWRHTLGPIVMRAFGPL